MEDFEIGYLMGLIVGEGSFTGDARQPCLSVRLHGDDPVPLERLKAGLGGKVYGPYVYSGRKSRAWLLRGHELLLALPILYARLPESKKRLQFETWLLKYGLVSIAQRSAFWTWLNDLAHRDGMIARETGSSYWTSGGDGYSRPVLWRTSGPRVKFSAGPGTADFGLDAILAR